MNSVDHFGEVLATVKPMELIPHGYIVSPKLVELNIKTKGDGIAAEPYEAIAHAYKDQAERLPGILNKMMVSMPGVQGFDDIINNIDKVREISGFHDIDVFTITGDYQRRNGSPFSTREEALVAFDKCENPCIIIFYNYLRFFILYFIITVFI